MPWTSWLKAVTAVKGIVMLTEHNREDASIYVWIDPVRRLQYAGSVEHDVDCVMGASKKI